jgi:hypothetical protein
LIMSARRQLTHPAFDREVIRDLARCFARAAVDEMFTEQEGEREAKRSRSKPKTARKAKS